MVNNRPILVVFIPAYNEEKNVNYVLSNLSEGYKEIEDKIEVKCIIVDDGSSDNTYNEIIRKLEEYNLFSITEVYKNEENIGLVPSFKKYVNKILDEYKQYKTFFLRTDFDKDWNHKQLLLQSLPFIYNEVKHVVFVRGYDITNEEEMKRENPLDILYKEVFKELIKKYVPLKSEDIDKIIPGSMGSQLLEFLYLKELVSLDIIKEYNERWGMDLILYFASLFCKRISPIVTYAQVEVMMLEEEVKKK